MAGMDISVKELVPIVVTAALWGSRWRRSDVWFNCDNMTVVSMLKKRSAKGEVAHHFLHCLSFLYSRNCFLQSPLGAAKTSLKRQVVCETRVANTCPCKVNTVFSQNSKRKAFLNSPNAHAALYTDILHLSCSKYTQKVVPSLHKPTTRYMYMCTLLWSHTQVH